MMGRVWCVDPDQTIYGSIYQRLLGNVYQLEQMASAEELFNRLQQGPLPDVIVLEKYQPDMDGMRICSLFRKLRACHDIPLLMVSEAAGLNDHEKARELGAFDYVAKPFEAEFLQNRVRAALAEREMQLRLQQLFTSPAAVEAPSCDRLTRLPGIGALQLALREAMAAQSLSAQPISLTLIDLDFFAFYSEAYGIQAADAALQKLAELLRKLAPENAAYRVQIDRFCVLGVDQSGEQALGMGQRICERTRLLRIPHASITGQQHLSVSIGTVTLRHGDRYSESELMASAEQALFQAKTWGRNQVRQFFEL